MNLNLTKKNLEHLFANNFSSPAFIMLANIYYDIKQYDRAQRVCQIGLKSNPNNQVGQYILSKIMVKNKKYLESEKLLKDIVMKDQNNIKALLLLLQVSEQLKRKQSSIEKYSKHLYQILPNNKKMRTDKVQKQLHEKSKKNKQKEINIEERQVVINEHMATKTMYLIMKKQKKYMVAKQILETMINKKNKIQFSKQELKTINSLIDKEKN
tara:strand:- start:400 stop:1032 length:633 start_codon:yes stop_codon:yes gene_type:complete